MNGELRDTTIEKILATVRTRSDADDMREAASYIEGDLYRTDGATALMVLKKYLSEEAFRLVSADAGTVAGEIDRDAARAYAAGLKVGLDRLVPLRIELSSEVSEELVERIIEWIRRAVGAHIILDMGLDRLLHGGMRMAFKGRYREMLLSGKIDAALTEERERMGAVLHEKKSDDTPLKQLPS